MNLSHKHCVTGKFSQKPPKLRTGAVNQFPTVGSSLIHSVSDNDITSFFILNGKKNFEQAAVFKVNISRNENEQLWMETFPISTTFNQKTIFLASSESLLNKTYTYGGINEENVCQKTVLNYYSTNKSLHRKALLSLGDDPPSVFGHSLTAWNSELILIGGCFPQKLEISDGCALYCPITINAAMYSVSVGQDTCRWSKGISGDLLKRTEHAAVVCRGTIIVFGGHDCKDVYPINEGVIVQTKNSITEVILNLPDIPLYGMAVDSNDRCLVVCGGYKGRTVKESVPSTVTYISSWSGGSFSVIEMCVASPHPLLLKVSDSLIFASMDTYTGFTKREWEDTKCCSENCKVPESDPSEITWVECTTCRGWLHVSCAGLSEKQLKGAFHCRRCKRNRLVMHGKLLTKLHLNNELID